MRLRIAGLRTDQLEYLWLILIATAVGMLGALGNLGFGELIKESHRLFTGLEWHALRIPRGFPFSLLIPVVLLSGGAVLLLMERFFPGDVLGYRFPDFLAMVNLGAGKIKRNWIVIKAAGAAVSLGAGASVGREGPIAQIGGAIGSTVAEFAHISGQRARVLIACGAGAGIATTFNSPIGGLMFAQEIVLLGETELANLTLLVIATTAGVVTSHALSGGAAIFAVQPFVLKSYWELLTYGLMGVAMGLLSAGFIRLFHATASLFERRVAKKWQRLAGGLVIVGAIAVVLPRNLSDGYPQIDLALAGKLSIMEMAALALAKIAASSISLGCGAPGGVFGPIFFIGTMAGGSFRALSDAMLPGLTGPRGSYALVGLGAFLAGSTHAPLTAIFLLLEMTQNYAIALPAMISAILALVISRTLENESIDTYALARQGKTLEIGRERIALTQIPVSSVMTSEVNSVPGNAPLADVLRIAGESAQAVLPVLGVDQAVAGVILTRDLFSMLSSTRELALLVNAWDICRRDFPLISMTANLDEAIGLMEEERVEDLPVIEQSGRLSGLVSRSAVVQAHTRATVSLSLLARRDSQIYWSSGYRVSRVRVPANAEGHTIRSLDPRQRFSVSVLAIRDGKTANGNFVPVEPDRELHANDLLVVAGRPAAIRQFELFLHSRLPLSR